MSDDRPVVLVVEDDPDVADLYAGWLREHWASRVAYRAEQALDAVDDDVAVVLLDRRLGTQSGDEVLETIREQGHDCRVAMVTAVDPDFEVVEMGFDDYLVKPVSQETLVATVRELLLRSSYDERMREYFALASKKALLEAEKASADLAESAEYERLRRRLSLVRDAVDEVLAEFETHESYVRLCRELSRADTARGPDVERPTEH